MYFKWCKFVSSKCLIKKLQISFKIIVVISVTRLGDLLDFGQVFKAFGNN